MEHKDASGGHGCKGGGGALNPNCSENQLWSLATKLGHRN